MATCRTIVLVLLIASLAHATHNQWSIINEKQLRDGSRRALVFRAVECCTGLRRRLPRFAKVVGTPCPTDPSRLCLPGRTFSGWYDIEHDTVVVADGNEEALQHEFIHVLKWANQGDISHDGPEWVCQ